MTSAVLMPNHQNSQIDGLRLACQLLAVGVTMDVIIGSDFWCS
jgi:hypothetical protein